MLALIGPDRAYRASFTEAIGEFEALTGKGDGGLTTAVLSERDGPFDTFDQYVSGLNKDSDIGRHQWWWCETEDLQWVARITLTLLVDLTQLEIAIRPSWRGQGHLTRILDVVLPVAEGIGATLADLALVVPADDHASRAELEAVGAKEKAGAYSLPSNLAQAQSA
jgi:GNAT superfamily N-acetyltransferase